MGHTHRYKFGFEKKIKSGKESQYMFSHPETGSDPPIGSNRESGRDTQDYVSNHQQAKTFSIRDKELLPIEPCSMILPLSLSPKVTYLHFIIVRKANFDSSPVMCLEQPLSKNHFSFFDPYKRKLRNFRYPNLFGSLVVSDL